MIDIINTKLIQFLVTTAQIRTVKLLLEHQVEIMNKKKKNESKT